MTQLVDLILGLQNDIKVLKTYIDFYRKSRFEQLRESWITGTEVKDMLQISQRKLQSLRDDGRLPFTRIDNKIYYRVSDIENLLERNYGNSKSGGKHEAE